MEMKKFPLILGMIFVRHLFLGISMLAGAMMLVGLYKPWVMLWWEDVQNRRKVIRLYGSIAIMSYIAYRLMQLI